MSLEEMGLRVLRSGKFSAELATVDEGRWLQALTRAKREGFDIDKQINKLLFR